MEITFNARDAGSVNRQMLHMDPDTDVEIFHPPSAAIVIETHTPATGGAFINNTLTGAGLERALTTSDLGGGGGFLTDVRTSNVLLTGTTFQTDLMTVALAANSRYAVEYVLEFSAPAADDIKFRLNDPGGASWNGLGLVVIGADDTIVENSPIGSQVNVNSGDASVHVVVGHMIVGTDGVAGDLSIDAAKQVDSGADGILFQGSWIRAQLLT
jgi:hypothetical protein